MRYIPDGDWMQKADRHTIQEIGIPSVVLMERAALKTEEILQQENIDCSSALIVCGSGNNGGDGFAVARLLYEQGNAVTVVFAGTQSAISRECRCQAEIVKNLGIPVVTALPDCEYTVIIDALFGVGLNRSITGGLAELLDKLNEMKGKKVALDIPSGICSRTGQVLGTAFHADLTVAFQCEKLGSVLFPGKEYSGKVFVVSIGIDTKYFLDKKEVARTYEREDLRRYLPARRQNSHKGTYGKVLMITGSKGMAGAAYLSAKAAYLIGAGLVQIYTEESNRVILQQLLPEAVVSVYTTYEEERLKDLLGWADVVCIGCGMGKTFVAEELLLTVLKYCKVPCVIDADGLNLLSGHREMLSAVSCPVVLTPHMKEMARLLTCSVQELTEQRIPRLLDFTKQYPVVCVLKDARTLVSKNGNPLFVNMAGNQAMAKAGAGDVLSGVITGLLAQKMDIYEGAVLGVYLHACAGDEAKGKKGDYSVLARDLLEGISSCLSQAAVYSAAERRQR